MEVLTALNIYVLLTTLLNKMSLSLGEDYAKEKVNTTVLINAVTTGKLMFQLGHGRLKELGDLAGEDFLKRFNIPFGSHHGHNAGPVNQAIVQGILHTGLMLVRLGKQILRELSALSGTSIGGDLLFRNRSALPTNHSEETSGLESPFLDEDTPDHHFYPVQLYNPELQMNHDTDQVGSDHESSYDNFDAW